MDFLLEHGFPIERIADSLRAASIGWIGTGCHRREYGPISIFATDPMGLNPLRPQDAPADDGESFYLFDGQFSTGTSYFHTLLPQTSASLPKRIDDLLERNSAVEAINAGVFVAGRVGPKGLSLITDPMGQYPLYYFQSGERFLISNVMRYLTIAMKASGFAATPSLLPCLQSIMFGGAIGDVTHVREIRRLPFGHSVHANPKLHFRPSAATDYTASYEALITETHDALMRHVVAVSGAASRPGHFVTDVTGGSDSRLVLSLLMASPLRDEFLGRCHAQFPHPDANVAGALFARYNLRIAQMPVVVDSDPHFWVQKLTQRSIDGVAGLTGGTHMPTTPFFKLAFPNLVHFGGSFGEWGGAAPGHALFRTPADLESTIENVIDLRIGRRRKNKSLELITEEGKSIVRNNAIAAIHALEDEGVPREQLNAEFYLRTRSRSHFGLMSWLNNKSWVAPNPLASPWMVAARRALPWALHSRNKVVFDLLRAGGREDLTKIPLANTVWDPEIVPAQERQEYQSIAAVKVSTPAMSPFSQVLWQGMPVYAAASRQRMTGDVSETKGNAAARASSSNSSRAKFTNMRYIDDYQAMLRDLVDRVPAQHDLWSLVDRNAVGRWGSRDGAKFTAIDTTIVGFVLSGSAWYLDQPEPAGVEELRNFDPKSPGPRSAKPAVITPPKPPVVAVKPNPLAGDGRAFLDLLKSDPEFKKKVMIQIGQKPQFYLTRLEEMRLDLEKADRLDEHAAKTIGEIKRRLEVMLLPPADAGI